jgi:hypothetical protein
MRPADLLIVASTCGALGAALHVLESPGAETIPELAKLRHILADWKAKLDELLADGTRGDR